MPVTYEVDEQVAILTHDDGKANAYGHDALGELNEALTRAGADPAVRAVLLAGRPGRFSAGFDLATMTSSDDAMRDLVKVGAQFVARLLLEPKPVVAACTGHALAAGALVLLAADHRVGAAGAWKIGTTEVSIGMALPVWAVELARYRVPPSALDRALVLGTAFTPEEAVAAGFLDTVVEAGEVLDRARSDAARLAQLRTGAVEATKRRVRSAVVDAMLAGIDEDLAVLTGPTPSGAPA